jgi:hypothetical protein
MRAAFGVALLASIAFARKKVSCCVNDPFPGCGACTAYSTSDWCNESEDNCESCGHWCPKWGPFEEDANNSYGISALQVVELIDGVLVGALETEHVDNLETCIKDITPLVTHIQTAVADFEDGSFHKIAAGIDELGKFISQVSTTMEDCEKVGSDDVTKLKAMGEAFLHPKKLIIDSFHHVILNGKSIWSDIKAADKDLIAGKYEAAGELYGTIGADILWGADNVTLGKAAEG